MTQVAPLTINYARLVINSWKLVREDIKEVGIAIFLKLLELNPEYQLLFKKFSHVPIKDLLEDPVFVDHATLVAKALDEALMQLENLNDAKTKLLHIGRIHENKNLEASHFIHCNDAILSVLKTSLGEKFTKDVETAWNKVLHVAVELIVRGMESDE